MTTLLSNEQVTILRALSGAPIRVRNSNGKTRVLTQLTYMGYARFFPAGHPPNWRITKEGRAALQKYVVEKASAPTEVEVEPVEMASTPVEVTPSVPRHELIDVVLLSLDDMHRHIGLLQQVVSELRNQQPTQ